MRGVRSCFAVAFVAAVACVVVAEAGAALSPGVYQARVTGATPAILNGTWEIDLGAGRYEIKRNGANAVDGKASIRGNTLTFSDVAGPFRCLGAQAKGSYRWTLSGKTLTLAVMHDPCAGRKAVLVRTFSKKA